MKIFIYSFFFINIALLQFNLFAQENEELKEPYVKKIWKKNIKNYVKRINSLESDDFSDLQFLKEIFKNKRIIFIGESSHQVREYNQRK